MGVLSSTTIRLPQLAPMGDLGAITASEWSMEEPSPIVADATDITEITDLDFGHATFTPFASSVTHLFRSTERYIRSAFDHVTERLIPYVPLLDLAALHGPALPVFIAGAAGVWFAAPVQGGAAAQEGSNSDGPSEYGRLKRELEELNARFLEGVKEHYLDAEYFAASRQYNQSALPVVYRMVALSEGSPTLFNLILATVSNVYYLQSFLYPFADELVEGYKTAGLISSDGSGWTGLSPAEGVQFSKGFLKLILNNYEFLDLFKGCRSPEDARRLIRFANEYDALGEAERHAIIFYGLVKVTREGVRRISIDDAASSYGAIFNEQLTRSLRIETLDQLIAGYKEGSDLQALRARAGTILERRDIPAWASASADNINELLRNDDISDEVRGQIFTALLAIEWLKEERHLQDTSAGRLSSWMAMLATFDAVPIGGWGLGGFGPGRATSAESIEGLMRSIDAFSLEIVNLPEPFRAVAAQRTIAEFSNPLWQIRMIAVKTAVRRATQIAPGERRPYIELLIDAAPDRSWRVALEAAKGAAYLAIGLEAKERNNIIKRLGLAKIALRFLKGGSASRQLEAFSLMDTSAGSLTVAEKRRFEIEALSVISESGGKEASRRYFFHLANAWHGMDPGTRTQLLGDVRLQRLLGDSIGQRGMDPVYDFLPLYSRDAPRELVAGLRDRLRQHMARRPTYLYALSKIGISVFPPDERLGVLKAVVGQIEDNDSDRMRIVGALSNFLAGADDKLKGDVLEFIAGRISVINDIFNKKSRIDATEILKIMVSQRYDWKIMKQFNLLHALSYLSSNMPEWQTSRVLGLFTSSAMAGQNNEFDMGHLTGLALPASHYVILINTIFTHFFTSDGQKRLALQLLRDSTTAGTLQQAVVFFRSFNSVSSDLRHEFVAELEADAERMKIDRLPININKAYGRLRQFLAKRFVRELSLPEGEKKRVEAVVQRQMPLWERRNLMSNLVSLQSFSELEGRNAISELVTDLTSDAAASATAGSGSDRFINMRRYQTLEGIFHERFISAWANGDKDFAIPLGELDEGLVISEDPFALRRSRYGYTLRQAANHLGIEGVSHMNDVEVAGAVLRYADEQLSEEKGYQPLANGLAALIAKLESLDDIGGGDIDEVIASLDENLEAMKGLLGDGVEEVVNDLKELKKNLFAGALSGQAWLVVSSDAAGFLNLGREPLVTCQDPTRNTGHNCHGQPVNRARDGRFRYAVVVIDKDLKMENGLVKMGKDAQIVARTQLEVTTDSGEPVFTERPKLLAERLYAKGGFIYGRIVADKLREFAAGFLSLDPRDDVFIQFDNLGEYPSPLSDDGTAIYRDTFHG